MKDSVNGFVVFVIGFIIFLVVAQAIISQMQ